MNRTPDRPHVLFLFSDTGGGHRSAAQAIIEALSLEFGDQVTVEMVDIFRDYAPPPFDLAPEAYPVLSRVPEVWHWGYRLSDGRRRTRFVFNAIWPYVRRSAERLLIDHPCDLIVSVHPLFNDPISRAARKFGLPYITVVTDLVSTHTAWYCGSSDLIIVPTLAARERGIAAGVPEERLKVIGLPVAERFNHATETPEEIRARLGWPQGLPLILLVGGGEGMGPLEAVAMAINDANLQAGLIVVCGRNQALRQRLEQLAWKSPTFVYGFVREMHNFMRAVDILITKAGPGTISEAFIVGLPIILYSRMPGQEDGNVEYVIREQAGVWAPEPEQVVLTLNTWLQQPEERQRVALNSHRLARPYASREIARVLMNWARRSFEERMRTQV